MDIEIYGKYKIREMTKSATLSEENCSIYDNIFREEKHEQIYEIDGCKLLERIAKLLTDYNLIDFSIYNNHMRFEFINYNNGESWGCYMDVLGKVENDGIVDKEAK
mgnify:CR=1 FL=1